MDVEKKKKNVNKKNIFLKEWSSWFKAADCKSVEFFSS